MQFAQFVPQRSRLDRLQSTAVGNICALSLLHFARVVDDAKCIVVTRVCVSVCPRSHPYSIARTRM